MADYGKNTLKHLVGWLSDNGLMGDKSIGASAGAALLFAKTVPRPEEVNPEIIEEFADAEKLAEYAEKMKPVAEWMEAQEFSEVYIDSYDGLRLHAYYLPAESPSKRLVIVHHGFTSKALDNVVHAKFFHDLGYEVLLLDLRAHGLSEGKTVGFGILDRFDTLEWVKYAKERFGEDTKIVLHGTSMGGATVLMALGLPEIQQLVSAVIADCAYTSPADVFSDVMKQEYGITDTDPIIYIANIFSTAVAGYSFDKYSTLEALRGNMVPVLFIHGKEDTFVPTWMSEKNYEVCTAKKQLLMVDNAGHGSSVFENQELYEQTEREFLKEVGL